MSVLDLLRSQNSIEHAPEPEPAMAPSAPTPGGAVPGAGPALPASASATKADPPGIQAQYYIENAGKERRYYKDLEGKQLAFRADSKAVTTKQEDRVTVSHMLDVAQARGWTSLHVRGTAAFKQEAWIEAQARGLSVKGYEPTAADRRNIQARRVTREKNTAAAPSATMQQPAQENTITTAAQPQQQRAQAAQPAQPAAPVSAPTSATSAAAQQVATGPVESQAEERNQRLDRKAIGEARPAERGADAGQLAGRTGEARREAPAAKAGDNPTQQEHPRHAREPWMGETGGYAALSPAQQASAERSHERWVSAGTPEKPHTMDLEEYVGHVQGKQAEARAKEASLEAKTRNGKDRGEAEPVPAPSAPAGKDVAESGSAEVLQLSPNARKVLAFLEQKIETQMANLTGDVKADLRSYAAEAIAQRETEAGLVRIPVAKPARKQATGRNQAAEAPKRRGKGGEEQKPTQVKQPRMSMGLV